MCRTFRGVVAQHPKKRLQNNPMLSFLGPPSQKMWSEKGHGIVKQTFLSGVHHHASELLHITDMNLTPIATPENSLSQLPSMNDHRMYIHQSLHRVLSSFSSSPRLA